MHLVLKFSIALALFGTYNVLLCIYVRVCVCECVNSLYTNTENKSEKNSILASFITQRH